MNSDSEWVVVAKKLNSDQVTMLRFNRKATADEVADFLRTDLFDTRVFNDPPLIGQKR